MKNPCHILAQDLSTFMHAAMQKAGVRPDVAEHVVTVLMQTSLRGVDSHGIRLFPHYLRALKAGRINPVPEYVFNKTSASTCVLNADHTFGHAATMEAAMYAVNLALESGMGAVAVSNSTHFGAAGHYAIEIAKHNMIGIVFTHADSLMRTYGGTRAFLGTNPIAFACPCANEPPFCLDMATTLINFNKVKIARETCEPLAPGAAADAQGRETCNPQEAAMLLPLGGYKGFGLSLMVEILCSMLTGMPYGPHLTRMFDDDMRKKRLLGHFVLALDIKKFQPIDAFTHKVSSMLNEIRNQPAADRALPVQVAGDPQTHEYRMRMRQGIPLRANEYEEFTKVAVMLAVPFNCMGSCPGKNT